jgi:hypothetical protein
MIDRLVQLFFRWGNLREAIFAEVHMYDELTKVIDDARHKPPTNLTWSEGDMWYGWAYDSKTGRYYFDDVGYDTMFELWQNNFKWDEDLEQL